MAFLGLAYGTKLSKCTGSSTLVRVLCTYAPALLMLMGAIIGASAAEAAYAVPIIYVAFVAFGVVALLWLAVQELIPEAKEHHADDPKWWISICIFAGIFIELVIVNAIHGTYGAV
jgi:zinc transporter ZupT